MTFSFDLTPKDWLALQEYYQHHSNDQKLNRFVSYFLFPLILLFVFLKDFFDQGFDLPQLILYLVSLALWFWFFPKFRRWSLKNRVDKFLEKEGNESYVGQVEMSFLEDVLLVKTSTAETKIRWSDLKKLAENDTYFFLFTSSISAFILPKAKLPDVLQVKNFLNDKLNSDVLSS